MKSKTKMLVFTLPPWHYWYWFIFLCKIKINFLLSFVRFVISLLCLDVFFFNHKQVVFKCSKWTPYILQMLLNVKLFQCSIVPKKENIDCDHHFFTEFHASVCLPGNLGDILNHMEPSALFYSIGIRSICLHQSLCSLSTHFVQYENTICCASSG